MMKASIFIQVVIVTVFSLVTLSNGAPFNPLTGDCVIADSGVRFGKNGHVMRSSNRQEGDVQYGSFFFQDVTVTTVRRPTAMVIDFTFKNARFGLNNFLIKLSNGETVRWSIPDWKRECHMKYDGITVGPNQIDVFQK